VATEVAARLNLGHELFERHVLMGIGVETGVAHPGQQLAERHRPLDPRAQDDRVGEEADERLDLGPGTVHRRRSDRHVVLARVVIDERLERGQQQHERRHALFARKRLQRR
jgi:hypothetical protein